MNKSIQYTSNIGDNQVEIVHKTNGDRLLFTFKERMSANAAVKPVLRFEPVARHVYEYLHLRESRSSRRQYNIVAAGKRACLWRMRQDEEWDVNRVGNNVAALFKK